MKYSSLRARQHILAHLSRRLIGELIVYEGIRCPSVGRSSVRPSVRPLSTFSNDISSEAEKPIFLNISHIASIGRGNA